MTGDTFAWPNGKRAAISLTFDDARWSQPETGIPILTEYGFRATFYVSLPAMEQRLRDWQAALAAGHEIGNHTLSHPCSANFSFARANPLEDHTLERIAADIDGASDAIHSLLGITPKTFAYPCGQKFVGRGTGVRSYVPLVAERFLAGRGFMDERPNSPVFCDPAQLYGCEFDCHTFDQLLPLIQNALSDGGWLVLAGHDVGESGHQVVSAATLRALCEYARDPSNGIWLDTVESIARWVHAVR